MPRLLAAGTADPENFPLPSNNDNLRLDPYPLSGGVRLCSTRSAAKWRGTSTEIETPERLVPHGVIETVSAGPLKRIAALRTMLMHHDQNP